MTNKRRKFCLVQQIGLCLGILVSAAALAAEPAAITIGYVDRTDDPDYAPRHGYESLYSQSIASPLPGAELAIKDAKLPGDAAGVAFVLAHITLEDGDDASAAVKRLLAEKQIAAVLLDLPLDETLKVAKELSGMPLALVNARHRDTALRQDTCHSHLFHTIPSWDMLEDALAQGLAKRNWKRALVIESDDPIDKAVSAAFQASAAKFGLTVTGVKAFAPGNDPRDRDRNNPRRLTGDADYDVVFVADHAGDFARELPYNTLLARPVVGAAGLVPAAWFRLWERQGAPQLTRRFEKAARRQMTELDWAAWAAVRAIVETVVRSKARTAAEILPALLDPALTLELYKGNAGSFRPWNRQLRQPILLATDAAVAGFAPVDGMLHRTNTLDTLGLDEPEFHCP